MANSLAVIDPTKVQGLADLFTSNTLGDFLSDLGGAGQAYPRIGTKSTRFQVFVPGLDPFILATDSTGKNAAPTLRAVILGYWPGFRKAFYLKKYDPNREDESAAPDCWSDNGVTPSPESQALQSVSCAVCHHNVFGTAVSADGGLGKGKRCPDKKRLIIYAQAPRKVTNGAVEDCIFHLDVPPASLKNLRAYLKELSAHGIPDPITVLTSIGFDPSSEYPMFTFSFEALLLREHVEAMLSQRRTDIYRSMEAPAAQAPAAQAPAAQAPAAQAPAPAAQAPAPAAQAPAPAAQAPAPAAQAPAPAAQAPAAQAPAAQAPAAQAPAAQAPAAQAPAAQAPAAQAPAASSRPPLKAVVYTMSPPGIAPEEDDFDLLAAAGVDLRNAPDTSDDDELAAALGLPRP